MEEFYSFGMKLTGVRVLAISDLCFSVKAGHVSKARYLKSFESLESPAYEPPYRR